MTTYFSKHPLVKHKLIILRNKDSNSAEFRNALEEVGACLFVEVTSELEVTEKVINTPITQYKGSKIKKEVVVVPILRAGLGFLNGINRIHSEFTVGMIGLARDEKTLLPAVYLEKLPEDLSDSSVYLLDPMLATGGSAVFAVKMLIKKGAKDITLISALASPTGVETFEKETKETGASIRLVVGELDEGLNDRGFIVPGLGDAGDRYFGG